MMKKTIVISFVKGKLFPDTEPVHSIYRLKEITTGTVLTEILELNYIELGKLDWQDKAIEQLNKLEKLGAYFCSTGDPEREEYLDELVRLDEGVISMTDKVLRKVSEDERLRAERESREMFEWEYNTNLKRAEAKGIASVAMKMKNDGKSIEEIMKYTGLSKVEIEKL